MVTDSLMNYLVRFKPPPPPKFHHHFPSIRCLDPNVLLPLQLAWQLHCHWLARNFLITTRSSWRGQQGTLETVKRDKWLKLQWFVLANLFEWRTQFHCRDSFKDPTDGAVLVTQARRLTFIFRWAPTLRDSFSVGLLVWRFFGSLVLSFQLSISKVSVTATIKMPYNKLVTPRRK